MDPERISLRHQAHLSERLKQAGTGISEYSFANLFLFRHAHDYRVVQTGDELYIAGKAYDGKRYLMPTQDPREGKLDELLEAAKDYDLIFPLPEEWLGVFAGKTGPASYSDNDSDYIFATERLATYKGQKLHSKKNLLNQFLDLYTPEAKPLTEDRMADALNILETWQRDVGEPKESTDYEPCREAFELYEKLVLCGGIYYVNGEPGGFIIGEEVNPDMFALHFAKGKRKFKGLYQYMYNHFANILPKQYTYLNFEQDLGKLALRIAKTSYHPDRVLKKYSLPLR